MKKVIFIALLVLVNISMFGQQQTQQPPKVQAAITLRQLFDGKGTILMNDVFAKEVMPLLAAVDTTRYDPNIILKPKSYTMGQMIRDSVLASMYRMGGVPVDDFGIIFHNFRYGSLGDIQLSPAGNVMFLQCRSQQGDIEYIINLAYSSRYRHWALEAYRYPQEGVKVVFAKGVQVLSTL